MEESFARSWAGALHIVQRVLEILLIRLSKVFRATQTNVLMFARSYFRYGVLRAITLPIGTYWTHGAASFELLS